ncbi:hypothetical protein DINM_006944 [Dirofilaria immitis]|nr:hypothetical protein [Dirofilaria immitis]
MTCFVRNTLRHYCITHSTVLPYTRIQEMSSTCLSLFFAIIVTFGPVVGQNYVQQMFGDDITKIIQYITKGDGAGLAYEWLSSLVDGFGHRMVGSDNLENKNLEKDNFDDVHTEEVPNLPKWVRGDDTVYMLEPRCQRLNILAIGGSEPADIVGEVVIIYDLDDAKYIDISGKIVVTAQNFMGYPETVKYRRAVKQFEELGAIGVLVKSITSFSINSPHTGSGAEGAKIPAASLAIEEADMIERICRSGNEKPSEVVLLSAHIDSWDIGQGAIDDGGGCAAVWSALHSLKQLGKINAAFKPKRTIRGVFWTAEEQGLLGAMHYYNTHKNNSNEKFYFVSETDTGAFQPTNWLSHLAFSGNRQHMKRLNEIIHLLNKHNIPLGLRNSSSQDGDLEYTAAIFAVLGHVIANMDDWGNDY